MSPIIVNPSTAEAQASCRRKYVREEVLEQHFTALLGAWGAGKSSVIKLTQASLGARPRKEGESEFVFVEFNAWLYQGYDDARAALMDVIATKLEEEAESREKGMDKAKALLKRVNWLRGSQAGRRLDRRDVVGATANRAARCGPC